MTKYDGREVRVPTHYKITYSTKDRKSVYFIAPETEKLNSLPRSIKLILGDAIVDGKDMKIKLTAITEEEYRKNTARSSHRHIGGMMIA